MHIYDFKNKKVALLGFGRSNSELLKYIKKYTDNIIVFDQKLKERPQDPICDGLEFCLGENCFEKLTGFDYIFRSPAIRPDNDHILKDVARGAVLTSEIEVFIAKCEGWIIGVTGSDGKTTTASLIYHILKADGKKAFLGGNIGAPLINLLEVIDPAAYVVLELSSFQLMTLDEPLDVAVVTNISPNHLDYHLSYDEYIEAKKNIIKYSGKGSVVVLNGRDKESRKHFKNKTPITIYYNSGKDIYLDGGNIIIKDKGVINTNELYIKGRHNHENLMAAIAATRDIAKFESVLEAAGSFRGVEHRTEYVDTVDGVTYINDSIATSPSRTTAGLKMFKKKVILIAGGKDKGIAYDDMGKAICRHAKYLVLTGQTSEAILKSVLSVKNNFAHSIENSLEEAVKKAHIIACEGDIVFFSPASTSFDMFDNFEHRGNAFKSCVKKLKEHEQ